MKLLTHNSWKNKNETAILVFRGVIIDDFLSIEIVGNELFASNENNLECTRIPY